MNKEAKDLFEKGNFYYDLSETKDREENLTLAINYYLKALEKYDRNKYFKEYAFTKMNLAVCYDSLFEIKKISKYADLTIKNYIDSLEIFTKKDFPYEFAKIKMNLGVHYRTLAEVKKPEKYLKLSISSFFEALEIFTKKDYLIEYSIIKMNLGIAYHFFSKVSKYKEEKLKLSISSYLEALETINKNKYLIEFAMIKMNLAISYESFAEIKEPEKYLKLSIKFYLESIKIFSRKNCLEKYSITLINLGVSYSSLSEIKDREKNLELAIKCYLEALEFVNKKTDSYNFSMLKTNLSSAYRLLSEIKDKEKNIMLAINLDKFQAFTRNENSYFFAINKVSLAISYFSLSEIRDKEKNLELSIENYLEALKIINKKNNQLYFSMLKMSLGLSYDSLSEIKDKEKNLELSISSYLEALELVNKESNFVDYLKIKTNLGSSYRSLSEIKDKEKNIILSINSYLDLLSISNNIDYKYSFAILKINLGLSYRYLSEIKDKEKNLELSISSYLDAIKIFSRKNFIFDFSLINMNLALSYDLLSEIKDKEKNKILNLSIKSFEYAKNSLPDGENKLKNFNNYILLLSKLKNYTKIEILIEEAIEYIEKTRINLLSPESKKTFFEESKHIYFYGIKNCITLLKQTKNEKEEKEYKKSLFRYIELSKTRGLIDAINSEEGRIIFDKNLGKENSELVKKIELYNKIEENLANIEKLANDLSSEISDTRGINRSQEEVVKNTKKLLEKEKNKKLLEKEREKILDELYNYPEIKSRLSLLRGNITELEEFQSFFGKEISLNTIAIQYYFSELFFVINVISKEKIENIIIEEKEKLEELNFYLDVYYDLISLKETNFKGKYKEILTEKIEKIEFEKEDYRHRIFDKIGKIIYKLLYKPAEEYFSKDTKRVIFITNSRLHNFAFNLLKTEDMCLNEYLVTKKGMKFSKILSASIWSSLKNKNKSEFENIKIFAVSNYKEIGELTGVKDEIEVRENFINQINNKNSKIIENEEVTPENFKNILEENCSILDLMGHGYAEGKDAGYFYTTKFEDKRLSVNQIYTSFPSLKNNKLVILALCKSGYQINFGEEVSGINSVFFMLGAGSTISNIIDLNDNFSAEFFKIFFENLTIKIKNPEKEKDLLDIFYDSLLEITSEDPNNYLNPEIFGFLEFQGNPLF